MLQTRIHPYLAALVFLGGLGTITSAEANGDYETMDYGPVLAESVEVDWPENNFVRKGRAIRLDHDTAVIFDSDLMRFAAGTVGGWLDISSTDYTSYKGSDIAQFEGRQMFGSGELAGWARDGSFDPERDAGMGNLPRDWAYYRGYYRFGDEVVLAYTVGDTEVFELPRAVEGAADASPAFVRNFSIGPAAESMKAYLIEGNEGWSVVESDSDGVIFETGDGAFAVRLADAPSGVALGVSAGGRVELDVPAGEETRAFRIFFFEMETADSSAFDEVPERAGEMPDLAHKREGGPARWEEEVTLQGELLTAEAGGYGVDEIPLPLDNPWGSWIRPSGIDFFEDGRSGAICTWNGDVWVFSGIDDSLENVTWRRFASGLFLSLGLAIVDGKIHVIERDQLTRLHDLNGNGEADFYENVNNDGLVYPMAHSTVLEVDSDGYFYFFKNGNRVPPEIPLHGALMRVSPDGKEREVFARGFRGGNSLAFAPDDTILGADQQGNWVPVERIDWIRQGRSYSDWRHGDHEELGEFEPPVTWIPYGVNQSTGAMVHTGENWGPLSDQWVLGSYRDMNMLLLLTEKIGDGMQGGVVEFPFEPFDSGLMRAVKNPYDDQIYVTGMRGWDTLAHEDGSFNRVRYLGGPNYMPTGLNVTPEGVRLTFSESLARAEAEDAGNYTVRRWQYNYSSSYGSAEYSVANPEEEGRDDVTVASATLSDDGRSVFVSIPDIRPVMQMMVEYAIEFEDGHREESAVYHTVNWLSEDDMGRAGGLPVLISGEVVPMEAEEEPREVAVEFETGHREFTMNCASCHEGGAIAPEMSGSEWAAGSKDALIAIVLKGKQGEGGVMAPFDWLQDEEIASILTYVRGHWHDEDAVEPSDVARVREETADRRNIWTAEELHERFE